MTILQIPDDLAESYQKLALNNGKDSRQYMLDALNTYLEDLEDERVVTERLADPQPTLSLEEVKRNFALDA